MQPRLSRTEQPCWGWVYVSNHLIIDTGLSVLSSNNEEIYCFVKRRSLIDRENVVRFQGTTVRFPRARELPSQNLTEPIILEKLNKPRGSLRPFLSPDRGVRRGSISLGCLGRGPRWKQALRSKDKQILYPFILSSL
jgi:hypothetical protein